MQLGYLIFWIIIVIILFEILGAIFSKNSNEFLMGNIVMLGFVSIGVFTYFSVRIFHRTYLIITKDEIVKFKRGKVIFKIKKDEIVELGYRKMSAFMFFLLPFWFFFGDPMCGVLSIRFYNAEVGRTRIFDSMLKLHSLNEEENARGLKEYCECFTAKEVRLICQKLELSKTKQIELK